MSDKNHYFQEINLQVSFPKSEEQILRKWKAEKIFEKSIEKNPEEKTWTFLDGPPFITGMPHYGSLLSSLPKDLFPRYWTMKGYRVRRVWGWDCHGLPAENKVEQKLGLESKKDIEEKIGVKKFIEECKLYVSEVSSEWEWYIDHIARWVDFKNAYKTMDTNYMESVMWVFAKLYEKELIYKGLRVSLYCPHCVTPISNFEVAMDADNYKDVTEVSNTYKYKQVGEKDTYFLAWSTTPWNKLATLALAINPNIIYVKVKQNSEFYILAKKRLEMLTEDKYEIIEEKKGSDLIGKSFVPHFDFYELDKDKKAHIIIPGDFVSDEEGTGIVTIAAYGEDDLKAMLEHNIQIVLHLDEEGHLKNEVPNWGGMYYLKVNKLVNEDLKDRGLVYSEASHSHSVPTCWRCHTRLIYAPQDAWFVDIQKLKDKLKENNEYINWIPSHFKHGRFLKSLESAPDWCISRSRYWGAPIPVWETPSGERFVFSSIKELEDISGQKITELHKPEIDEITFKSPKTGETAKRVPEVLDSWIEAGSASLAERHYPFTDQQDQSQFYPPDFIIEYTGQIRAWFYVLHVIATGLKLGDDQKNIMAKNVLVTGVIKGADGRKMSKNFGNYPDPKEMLEKYGGDALRLYLLGSPVMHAEDILISEEEYKNQVRGFLIPLVNVCNFFVTYANTDSWTPKEEPPTSENILDQWIISRLNSLIQETTQKGYESFDTPQIVNLTRDFLVNDLSGWFIRRSRDRVGPSAENSQDKTNAYQTTWFVLTTYLKLVAPLIPFLSESLFTNLTKRESVHLENWPEADTSQINTALEAQMQEARKIVESAHAQRKENNIKVRQPLASLDSTSSQDIDPAISTIVKEEVNVLNWNHTKSSDFSVTLDLSITPELESLGKAREIVRKIQEERKNLKTQITDKIDVWLEDWPIDHEVQIKSRALVRNLAKGDFKLVVVKE